MTLETDLKTHDSLQPNNNMPTKEPATNRVTPIHDVSQDCREQTISQDNSSDVSTLMVTEEEFELWEQIKDLDFGLYQPLNGNLLERLKQMKEELIQLQQSESQEFTKQLLAEDNELQENCPFQISQRSSSANLYKKRGRPIKEYKIGAGNEDKLIQETRKLPSINLLQESVEPVESNPKVNPVTRRVSFQDLTLSKRDIGAKNEVKRPSSPRLDPVASDVLLACKISPPANVSEGLRKYRRKSQFTVPSDIPSDVPLKRRHVENELRIKDTLEFIKRRLSVQQLHDEETRHTPQLDRKVCSNPTFVHNEVDSTNEDSNRLSNFRNSSPIMGDKPDQEYGALISPTDSTSYMSSQESEGMVINFDRVLNDEELDEYLGNIPSGQRQFGLLPLPKDKTGLRKTPQFLRSQSTPASSPYESEHHIATYNETSSESLPKYVPLKKQRNNVVEHKKDNVTPAKHYLDIKTLKRYGSDSSIMSSASLSSLGDYRLAAHIRKDSIAIFNTKLHDKRSRLRKISQASWAQFEQLKQKHMEMSKEEMLRTYRLHIFVLLIFLVIVISISMSWYYKTMAKEILLARQAIIFDPRTRRLELSDPSNTYKVHVKLGKEIPSWILPLHCPEFEKKNLNVKKCVWKNKAVVTVRNFGNEQVNCYNVSWDSLQHQYFPHDCLDLGSSVWYGPSNQSSSIFPIKGSFQFQHSDFTTQNNGVFGSRPDYYWLSSTGASLYVHPDMPVQLFWNMTGALDLCVVSNFTGPLYHHKQSLPYLNYTVCQSQDALETHAFMQHNIFSSSQFLNVSAHRIFQSPFWSVKSFSAPGNVTQANVATLIAEGEANGFAVDQISLDVAWEQTTGDLTFDPLRFNATLLEELSREKKRQIVLTLSPYFKFSSKHFELGVYNSTFVKDAGGKVPGLILYNGELVAVLDVFNGIGMTWYAELIQELKNLNIDNFRLTYGTESWLPYKPQFHLKTGTPNMYRRLMTEAISRLSENLIVEHSSDSRHVAGYVPVAATIDSVNGRNCIVDVIEESLTLSLMGYPLIMMDGYRERNGAKMTSELYKRWLQLALTFPAYQISTPPWRFDQSVTDTANQLQLDRNATFNDLLVQLARSMLTGQPLIRPVWWPDSRNDSAHRIEIKDQFLLGDEFLVAPILCEGKLQRDIYIPSGIWELDNSITLGPKVLYNYTMGLDRLLVFKHRKQQ